VTAKKKMNPTQASRAPNAPRIRAQPLGWLIASAFSPLRQASTAKTMRYIEQNCFALQMHLGRRFPPNDLFTFH
jgi:hypothetical protein